MAATADSSQVVFSTGFYPAEAYHQDFLRRNPYKQFPELYHWK
jgi:peptide methionine sulfoxide reductase MsrA